MFKDIFFHGPWKYVQGEPVFLIKILIPMDFLGPNVLPQAPTIGPLSPIPDRNRNLTKTSRQAGEQNFVRRLRRIIRESSKKMRIVPKSSTMYVVASRSNLASKLATTVD